MPVSRSAVLGVLLWLLAAPAWAQNGSEPIVVTDLLQIRELGSVAVSPDGRQVAYTVTRIEEGDEEPYAYRTHLWLLPVGSGGEARPLTRGDRSATEPAWHPEGDRLAFVRAVEGTPQVFVLPLMGGEAYQLTDTPHGASHPRWSPDGTRILFTSSLPDSAVRALENEPPRWPDERPGRTPGDVRGAEPDPTGTLAQIRAWLEENAEDNNPRVFNRLDLQGELDLEPQMPYGHLFVVEAAEGAEPVAVTRGYYSYGGGAWRSDEEIVFHGAPFPDRHPDRVRESNLYTVRADGSGFGLLLDLEGYTLFDPTVSPDGQTIAFLGHSLEDPGYAQLELGVLPLGEEADALPQWLTLDFDRSVNEPQWSPDGWHLYFVAPSEGGFPLYRVAAFGRPETTDALSPTAPDTTALAADTLTAEPLAADTTAAEVSAPVAASELETGPEVEQLTDVRSGIRSYDLSRATIFFVKTEPTNPYELYATTPAAETARRLTDHNASWLADKRLSLPEARTLTRDTLDIPYWIMRPAFYEEGRQYPLLVEIHGGPSAMWGPGEASMWLEFQFFASRGYGVVYSNPRGSGGYGYTFERANYQDWGQGPADDVLAVAEAAAREPWVDPDRQVVTGGSYAGYLTAWIVAHTDRFQAAVAQRGVYDLPTFLGEGNAWRLVPFHFGGYPWEDEALDSEALRDDERPVLIEEVSAAADARTTSEVVRDEDETEASPPAAESIRDILIRNSPLTFVDQITTPLLIIHGDNDLRTGVIQSEMLYKSLKILDRPVEYVRYPEAGHELSRSGNPKQRMDRILRIYEFLARYVE